MNRDMNCDMNSMRTAHLSGLQIPTDARIRLDFRTPSIRSTRAYLAPRFRGPASTRYAFKPRAAPSPPPFRGPSLQKDTKKGQTDTKKGKSIPPARGRVLSQLISYNRLFISL